MNSVLHISGGDAFTQKIKSLDIAGDVITWREMLCEGKTLTEVGSESFWKTRYDFLHKNYKVSKSWFINKTLKEYRSLCNHKKQDQIILWFDKDLFSQVNMIAVISWLLTHRKYAQIFVINANEDKGKVKESSLKDLTKTQLQKLYTKKQLLSEDAVEHADYAWQLYCSNNPIQMEKLFNYEVSEFPFLNSAVQTHLERFPSVANGLNTMENAILKESKNKDHQSRNNLLFGSIKNQNNLGFTSQQYERALTRLQPLFQTFNPTTLTIKGNHLLANSTNYYGTIKDANVYLGGVLKYDFLYDTVDSKILKL